MPDPKATASALRSLVPVNARTFLGTMLGDRSDITEADMTEDDLNALRFAVKQSQQNYAGRQKATADALRNYADADPDEEIEPGWTVADELRMAEQSHPIPNRIDYSDYDMTREQAAPQGEDRLEKPWWSAIKNSFDNPTYRMQTTVGGGGYEQDPDGNTIVTDQYDWNTNRPVYAEMRDNPSKWDYLKEHAGNPVAIGDLLGSMLAPADDPKVRQTRINLGKLK